MKSQRYCLKKLVFTVYLTAAEIFRVLFPVTDRTILDLEKSCPPPVPVPFTHAKSYHNFPAYVSNSVHHYTRDALACNNS